GLRPRARHRAREGAPARHRARGRGGVPRLPRRRARPAPVRALRRTPLRRQPPADRAAENRPGALPRAVRRAAARCASRSRDEPGVLRARTAHAIDRHRDHDQPLLHQSARRRARCACLRRRCGAVDPLRPPPRRPPALRRLPRGRPGYPAVMRSVLVLLGTLLLVLVPARTGVAQPPAPRTERLAAHAERLLAARADLAQAAFEAGLWREAGMFVRAVVAAKPGHSVARLADELKAMPSDAFVRTYREAVEKHGSTFRKRVRQTLAPLADELVSLADEALAAGERELAEQWYARAYQVDSDNGKALQAPRKFDYDAIFNYGVLPREDKKEARDVLRRLGGRFLQRDDLARELEYWSDAWGLQTKHYRFVANAAHGTVFAFAQACEDLYEAWEAFMTAHRQPLRALTKPSTVFLFASRIDYECVLRLRGEDPPDSSAVLGYYAPATKIGYFYYDEEFYAGDKTLLF